MHLRQDLVLPISIYGLVPVLFAGGQTPTGRIASYGLTGRGAAAAHPRALLLGGLWLSVG